MYETKLARLQVNLSHGQASRGRLVTGEYTRKSAAAVNHAPDGYHPETVCKTDGVITAREQTPRHT